MRKKPLTLGSKPFSIFRTFAQPPVNTIVFYPPETPLVIKEGGTPTTTTPPGLRAIVFWTNIQAMANKIKKEGHTSVSYQDVADLFAEHHLDFDTVKAPTGVPPLTQLCLETIDAHCTLPQEMELLVITNPIKKLNFIARYRDILESFQDVRTSLQELPAAPTPSNLKDLFSTISTQISECCPTLKPYISLKQDKLDALFEKNKQAFTQHMQAPHANQKWAIAFVAERHFLNFLIQSINIDISNEDVQKILKKAFTALTKIL